MLTWHWKCNIQYSEKLLVPLERHHGSLALLFIEISTKIHVPTLTFLGHRQMHMLLSFRLWEYFDIRDTPLVHGPVIFQRGMIVNYFIQSDQDCEQLS